MMRGLQRITCGRFVEAARVFAPQTPKTRTSRCLINRSFKHIAYYTTVSALSFGYLVAYEAKACAQSSKNLFQEVNVYLNSERASSLYSVGSGAVTSRKGFLALDGSDGSPWSLNLSILSSAYYNSNAEQSRTQGTSTLEGTPDARLSWKRVFPAADLVYSGFLDADIDRYVRSRGAGADTFTSAQRIQYNSQSNDQELQPFVQYFSAANFIPTFSRSSSVQQKLSFGFDKAFNFDDNLVRIRGTGDPAEPIAHSDYATVWSVGLTGSVSRNFSDAGPSSYSLFIAPAFTWNISNYRNQSGVAALWTATLEVDLKEH